MKQLFIKFCRMVLMLIVCLLMINNSNQALADQNEIILGTAQWVDNLNPFTYTSYPAELIIQLTTDRLIQRICTGREYGAYRPILHEPYRQYVNLDYDDHQSKFSINLIENSPVSFSDIHYSLKQISETPMNRYHEHKMIFIEKMIELFNPRGEAFPNAAAAFTFPVIKQHTSFKDDPEISGRDHITKFNNITTGIYKISSFERNEVVLKHRHNKKASLPLKIQMNATNLLFTQNVMDKLVHIGLCINGNTMKELAKDQYYQLEETDDLNSFTYFGFNYNTNNKKAKKLFAIKENQCHEPISSEKHFYEFREAFAFAVGETQVVQDLIYQYGAPMDHTFDTMRSFDGLNPPVDYLSRVKGKISRYVRSLYQTDEVTLRILYRPNSIFNSDHVGLILDELNKKFRPANIQFRLIAAPTTSQFIKMKMGKEKGVQTEKNYDIILDTFVYGQNKLRYIEFMNPENDTINFLGCKLFCSKNIDNYKEKVELRDEFLQLINRKLPVFVVGRFRNVNVVSPLLKRPERCEGNGRMIPFTDIHQWTVLEPVPVRPEGKK